MIPIPILKKKQIIVGVVSPTALARPWASPAAILGSIAKLAGIEQEHSAHWSVAYSQWLGKLQGVLAFLVVCLCDSIALLLLYNCKGVDRGTTIRCMLGILSLFSFGCPTQAARVQVLVSLESMSWNFWKGDLRTMETWLRDDDTSSWRLVFD